MELLPDTLNLWLLNYGNFAIFGLLALGIIALPVPEETLLIVTGYLIQKGTFNLVPTFISALCGSILGITVSFLIGHFGGLYLIKKYGPYLGLSDSRMQRAHNWFERYGRWFLFIGYFIPGVRHFTGVLAGVTDLSYRHFATYAYSGAFFWVSTFLTIGYFFGNYDREVLQLVEDNLDNVLTGATLLIIAVVIGYVLLKKKNRIEG